MNPEQNHQPIHNDNVTRENSLFEKAKQRIAQLKQISIIGLCDKGDVIVVNDPVKYNAFLNHVQNQHENKTIRRIHKSFVQDEQKANELCNQLNFQRQLHHPFILPIQDILQGKYRLLVLNR